MVEAETWAAELGYGAVRIDSRLEAVGFYERLGYAVVDGTKRMSGCFECVEMRKSLERVAGEPVRRGEEEKDPGRMEPPRKAGAGPVVVLKPLEEGDREAFIAENQEAFNDGALAEFGRRDEHFEEDGQIISRETIARSIREGEAWRIVLDGRPVGGLVLRTEGARGELELLFVKPGIHGRGIGQAAWRAVEALHPEVCVWETATPYFEKRNIHFYVNKCGFRIVEFFCARHPGSGDGPDGDGFEMFRFEKRTDA